MAKIKPARADAKVSFDGFSGLGQATPLGRGCSDLCNWRPTPDGSLTSRAGYRKLFSFPGARIRGLWDGTLESVYHCFTAAGDRVYLLTLDGRIKTTVATIPEGDADVTFLCHEDTLYLLTGEEILSYSVEDKTFSTVVPYTPLYGENWDPVTMGEVKEVFNLLTPTIRVHYANPNGSSKFFLPYYAKSVERVRIGRIITDDFTLSDSKHYVTVPSGANYLGVEISFTVDLAWDSRDYLMQARAGLVYPGVQYDRMLLSGGATDARVYPSTTVTDAMLSYCRSFHPDAKPLYFRAEDALYLGNTTTTVNCFFAHRDKVFAFCRDGGWMLYEEDGRTNAIHVTEQIGTAGAGVAARYGESMALAGEDGLYVISSLPSHPEDLSFRRIPYPEGLRRGSDFLQNLLLDWRGDRSELWLRDRTDTGGSVWIRNTEREAWYRFDGIPATCFRRIAEGACFGTANGMLYLFDPSLYTDDGKEITLFWQMAPHDLGMPETMRRSLRLSFVGDLDGGSATLRVTRDGRADSCVLNGKSGGGIEQFDLRFPARRHRFLELALTLPASEGVRLCKLAAYTKR